MFVLEKRIGNSDQHFEAVRKRPDGAALQKGERLFEFDEVLDVLVAYAFDAPAPDFIDWKSMKLG